MRTDALVTFPLSLVLTASLISPFSMLPAVSTSTHSSKGIPSQLERLEPRTPIASTDLPLEISHSGSYFLVENVRSETSGIVIKASHVSIDLMGFSLQVPSSAHAAISAEPLLTNVAITGGTVIGGEVAIQLQSVRNAIVEDVLVRDAGIGIAVGDAAMILNSRASSCDSTGIIAGVGALIRNSTSLSNRQGLEVGSNSSLSGLIVSDNDGAAILAGDGSLVHNSVISRNQEGLVGGTSVSALDVVIQDSEQSGIRVGVGSEVRGCVLQRNKGSIVADKGSSISHCSISDDEGTGVFLVGPGGAVRDNTLENVRTGIKVGDETLVVNNSCRDSILCIQVFGSDNRLESNHIGAFDRGIEINGSANVLASNTVKAPGTGIKVSGTGNWLTGNTVKAASCGLRFLSDASNGYRSNTFLSVDSMVCGFANVNAGENIAIP
jgi:hypothetical protein